jgi:DMSO/TMAO reductase YedYZ molybdopterin-dependent catalytic subunit
MLAVVAAAALLAGCSADASSLPYLEDEVVVKGLTDEDFTVTISDLTQMEAVSKKAEGQRSNGDIVKLTAVGPTLASFVEKYGGGKPLSEFSAVRFTSLDGYSVAVPREILEKREVVLAYMDGSKKFDKGQSAPLRAVVLGERAMYWARMVCEISFETGTSATVTDKVVFLDTALPLLGETKGSYSEEEGGDIVSTIDILLKYGGMPGDGDSGAKVYMAASDGLKKNETMDNFLKGYLKYTGDLVPQFCSPDLPEGMNMNTICSIRAGTTLYASLARGLETWGEATGADGHVGVGFTDMIKDQGFATVNVYQLTDVEGQTYLFNQHELVAGVFAEVDGAWGFYPPTDDEELEPVTSVVSVEAVGQE